MKKEVIICFDLGNEQSGWVVYSKQDKYLIYKNKEKNNDVIEKFQKYLVDYSVIKIAIEYPSSYGMPVNQTLLDMTFFCGVIAQIARSNNIEVELVFRKSVKMFLTGSVRSNDSQINSRVYEICGPDNTNKKKNEWWYNEEMELNGGAKWSNGDINAAVALLLYIITPHDILIKNENEQERNKISKEVQIYLLS